MNPLEARERIRDAAGEQPAFSRDEHEDRVARAQAAMRRHEVDLLVLFDPQSLGYFTGYSSVNMWDFSALVLPRDAEPRVVLWDFELGRFATSANVGEVYAYPSHSDPMPVLAAALEGLPGTTYATDDWSAAVPPAIWSRVLELFSGRELKDGRRVLWETRLYKSPAERSLLREVARMTDTGMRAVEAALAEGVADFDLAAAASEAMLRAGSEHFSIQPIVATGARAGIPHSESNGARVVPGECVFVEIGANRHRYTAPLMRTLVLGDPRPELALLAQTASDTIAAVMRTAAPGIAAKDIAIAGQAIIDADPTEILFHRWFGYPVGFGVPPSWLESLAFQIHAGNEELLTEGMVFHVPLSLRHLGRQGVGLSQSIEITADSAAPLSQIPASLIVKDA